VTSDRDERVGVDARSDLNDDTVIFVDHCTGVAANYSTAKYLFAAVLAQTQ